ncbi:hypothetical protein KKF61_07960 [Patescibacteria group bacterium]|nr:hypothetical protein [Patescibacteria group bacterium]
MLLQILLQQIMKNMKKASKGEEITPESQALSVSDIGSALMGGGAEAAEGAQAPEAPTDIQTPTEAPPIPKGTPSFDQGDVMATPTGQIEQSFAPVPKDIMNRNWQDVPSYMKQPQLERGFLRGGIDSLSGQIRPEDRFAPSSIGRETAHAVGGTLGDILRSGLGAGSAGNQAYQKAMAEYYREGQPIVSAEGVEEIDPLTGKVKRVKKGAFKKPVLKEEKEVTLKQQRTEDYEASRADWMGGDLPNRGVDDDAAFFMMHRKFPEQETDLLKIYRSKTGNFLPEDEEGKKFMPSSF